jgi:hypothetical protein
MSLTTQEKVERMLAQNRATGLNASITDVSNFHNAMLSGAGGQSSTAQKTGSAVNPVSGATPKTQSVLGGGGKGGGRPNIDPSKVADSKLNNDKNYGYYRPDGTYVSAFVDMRDGGGKNQSGNYFVGGGLLSSLLNAAKIRPAGAARERNPETGEYIVPREQIGYANFTDWIDRGGPQARGGKFQGLGGYSAAANMLYDLSGKDFGERVPYGASVQPASTGSNAGSRSASPRPVLRSIADPNDPYAPIGQSNPAVAAEIARRQEALRMQSYEPSTSGSNLPNVQQDFSNISAAPAIRSGLIDYNPQVVAGTAGYTPTPTQGVTDEAYLPAGTQTGSSLSSQTMAQAQRARDYMNYKNAGGKSSYEEWTRGIYR